MNGDLVLAPEGTPNMRLTPIIMLKSLPVNRFLGQGSLCGEYLCPLGSPTHFRLARGRSQAWVPFQSGGLQQTLILLSPKDRWG